MGAVGVHMVQWVPVHPGHAFVWLYEGPGSGFVVLSKSCRLSVVGSSETLPKDVHFGIPDLHMALGFGGGSRHPGYFLYVGIPHPPS